jgi:hypothetical protein
MKTVAEFLAGWKVYGDDKEFRAALEKFQAEAFHDGLMSAKDNINAIRRDRDRKAEALGKIASHCQASGSPIAASMCRIAQESL